MGQAFKTTFLLNTSQSGFLLPSLINSYLELIRSWQARARSRRHLARLDERLLRDIGVDRFKAKTETSKFFWEN